MERSLILIVFYFFVSAVTFSGFSRAEADTKKSSPQQVGGLLFDMDEGAEIEQGPGGSVYVKSNREYLQKKFADIETRLLELEQRTAALENKLRALGDDGSEEKKEAANSNSNSGRTVLIS